MPSKTALYYKEGKVDLIGDITPVSLKACVDEQVSLLWLDMIDPPKEEMDILEKIFELHPLTIEDFINTNSRPKIDNFEKYIFIVLHSASLTPRAQRPRTVELNICVGTNFVITIHPEPLKGLTTVFERANKNAGMMDNGPGSLLHMIVDSLVDNYMPVLDVLEQKLTKVEADILDGTGKNALQHVFTAKKDIIMLRRIIGPQRETINLLSKETYPFITAKTRLYFRDVYDNFIFINDTIDNYRDIVNGVMESYMSIVSNRTNDIMKVLTMIATIMMPLTLISGIYGMNFEHMPFLRSKSGFWGIAGLMLMISIGMMSYFRRKRWI